MIVPLHSGTFACFSNKSSGYGWSTSIYDYLWHEHPIGADGHLDTIGGGGNTVFRYKYDQTFDISHAKYLVFDLNMFDDTTDYGANFKKLISYSNGQIEFSSSGGADVNEYGALWNVVWDNSYYIDQNNAGWHQIWVPLSIFTPNNGTPDLTKINFFGMYWNATDSTVRVQMANPTIRYELPASAKDIR